MKKILLVFITLSACCGACNKVKIKAPDGFTVTTAKSSYTAGDSVLFSFKGNPDNITFYSGEPGRNYDNRNRDTASGGAPQMQFLSNVQFGTTTLNNLSVLVSSNFNGQFDTTDIRAAAWSDITNRAVLGSSATNTSSGLIKLSDLAVAGKPLYVAFRYLSSSAATLKQRNWAITTFQFSTLFPDGSSYTHAASNADAAFGIIGFSGDSANWVSGTSLTHVGLPAGNPADEDWAISKAFNLNLVNSDIHGSVNVKAINQPAPSGYTWKYTTPGTYKAVFIGQNSDVNHAQQVVREITITITP